MNESVVNFFTWSSWVFVMFFSRNLFRWAPIELSATCSFDAFDEILDSELLVPSCFLALEAPMVRLYRATTVDVPRWMENSMSFLDLFFLIVKSFALKPETSSFTPRPSPKPSMLKGIGSIAEFFVLFIKFYSPASL